MSNDRSSYEGSFPTPEARGIDAGYEAVRDEAERELKATMAGPRHALQQVQGDGIKNPEGEFAIPAPATAPHATGQAGPGPSQVGNSSGRGPIDPQGQQAGTEGGQRGSPPSDPGHAEVTPLAAPKPRGEPPHQQAGAGVDTKA